MGCIPPIPDFNTGAPTCPIGFTYDPVQNLCCPNSTAPVNMNDPTIRAIVTGLAGSEIDPAQASRLGMEGVKASGIIERAVVAFLRGIVTMAGPLLQEAASLLDDFLVVLSQVFFYAQGQRSSGYYLLVAALMEDMLGIQVDGAALYQDFQTGGRLKSMVALGGSLFNTLAGEFAGVAQSTTEGAFTTAPGTGIGGLPAVKLSPQQGVDGARALIGFVTSFAVREGNTDLLADYLPMGLGHWFKDFAEDFSKSLGIGRMLRPALKNLVSVMVANPMLQALNLQYRPTLLDGKQTFSAWNQGVFTDEEYKHNLALHGFDDSLMTVLQWEYLAKPSRAELQEARMAGIIDDGLYATWMHRLGYTDNVISILNSVDAVAPMRAVVLQHAKVAFNSFLSGRITDAQYAGIIDSIKHSATGRVFLSDAEVDSFKDVPVFGTSASRRHLTVGQLTRHYEDGLITLGEFEAAVTAMGYSADEVVQLTQELLVSAKRAADRAAKAAALAARGPLAKLTVAQLETGYLSGLFDVGEIETELTARKYAPDAINALIAEFRIKAGLQTKTPPTV